MRKSRFTDEQMVGSLRETGRTSVVAAASRHGVSEQTIYVWRRRFGTPPSQRREVCGAFWMLAMAAVVRAQRDRAQKRP